MCVCVFVCDCVCVCVCMCVCVYTGVCNLRKFLLNFLSSQFENNFSLKFYTVFKISIAIFLILHFIYLIIRNAKF